PPGARLSAAGDLVLEDGTNLGRRTSVPADAPYGYHRILRDDGTEQHLISGPGRCWLPVDLRTWGWVVQLAATRSAGSWGIGDLVDLADLARLSAGAGAGFLAVGPLTAPNPGPDPDPSPYYPSTRRFGSPLHVAVDAIAGADAVANLAARGRALNGEPLVDRRRALALKMEALDRLWSLGTFDQAAFGAWRNAHGASLERWAEFSALAEALGADWRRWPSSPPPARPDRVAFHAWVQWCFDGQLAEASRHLRRVADMPVGVDPAGFDAWDWQDQLTRAASLGVPPDRFNPAGQDWGFPPFVPHRLRQAGFRPFIETVRAQLRHAGGLRIDHVLGLFRLWWVPTGADPTEGAYVTQPAAELLEIMALESHRAGAIVIGEDLGTVPAGVRPELRRRGMLSTRLALFERVPPERYPRQTFAGVTTHDLPTVAGLWSGADVRDQAAAGREPDPSEPERLRARLARAARVAVNAPLEQAVVELHRRLAGSPSMLIGATLEDALGVETRPNLPGTVPPARPNWSVALPVSIERLGIDPRVVRLAEALRRIP
ncbi:MAG: 4-alpha-glucanotransferase, partial [Candidatus Limnocylindria bacterium]